MAFQPLRRRPWLLTAASVLLALGLLEGFVRLSPTPFAVRLRRAIQTEARFHTVAHPYVGHLNRPDGHSDPYGFPNEWPWPEAPEIVTLGDSLTLGGEANPAWPAIMARALAPRAIVNLAVAASGPQQYLRVFETFGARLSPKLVLVGFFPRNDFWDAAMFEQWLKSGAGGNYLVWRNTGRPPAVSLSLRQPARKFARSAIWRAELAARKTYLGTVLQHSAGWHHTGAEDHDTEVYDAPEGTRVELRPEDFYQATKAARPGRAAFARVLAALQRIASLARRQGAETLVVFVPSKEEVYLPLVRGDFPDSAASLREALEQLGIPWLDLLDDFRRRAAGGEVLFIPTDSQLPNASGQALIADLVLRHIRARAVQYGLAPARRTTSAEDSSESRQSSSP